MVNLEPDRCRQYDREPHPQASAALMLPRLWRLWAQYLATVDEGHAHSYCAAVQGHEEDV